MSPAYPWPIRPGAASLPILTELRGLTHPLVTWAALPAATPDEPATLLHLSAVGSTPRLRALWADLLDARRTRITLRDRHGNAMTAARSDGRYVTAWSDAPLPTSGLMHLSLTVADAYQIAGGALAFPHIGQGDDRPDLRRFFRQLDAALSIPLVADWAPQLWQFGAEAGLIRPVPCHGVAAWWVDADEPAWTRLAGAVLRGVPAATLESGAVRVIGEVTTASLVVEAVNEGARGREGE
jgi:hypothetical protein